MTATELLQTMLGRAWSKSAWHAFTKALKGLTEEDARWLPPAYKGWPFMNGSILDIAFHVAGDKHVQINHALGDGKLTWPQVRKGFNEAGGDLKAALSLGEEGQRLLQEALAGIGEDEMSQVRRCAGGIKMRTDELFMMLIEHDLYHAGQVMYIRCVLEGRRGRGQAA